MKINKIILIFVISYSLFIFFRSLSHFVYKADRSSQEYLDEYKNITEQRVMELVRNSDSNFNKELNVQLSQVDGRITNFEGPQVKLKGIKFHNEILTKEDERLFKFDGVSAQFDPDHTCFGLPDVCISLSDVRIYQPEDDIISRIMDFGTNSNPKPYKTYKKKITSDTLGGKDKYFYMQLYLTEFNVSVKIKPTFECNKYAKKDKREDFKYPGYWYGSARDSLSIKELKQEAFDNRYSNLGFILEISPDASPLYLKTESGSSSKADFAIAAVYCNRINYYTEDADKRISGLINKGQPLYLNTEFSMKELNKNKYQFSDNVSENADKLIGLKSNNNHNIWNKQYYMQLFFNNLGTYRSGIFNQNQYHDQVDYTFLMPVFVVGSWDVIPPNNILPEWEPPTPYFKEYKLKNLIPFWNRGIIGKSVNIMIGLLVLWLVIKLVLFRKK